MRKLLQSSIYLMISIFLFTSCEAWEDESYHAGGDNNGGGGMLLKEVKTISDGVEGKVTYTYDSSNRMKEVYSYANVLDTETYSHTLITFSNQTNAVSVTKVYMMGQLFSTVTSSNQLVGNNTMNVDIQMDMGGLIIQMNNVMTFSAPCGTSQNVITTTMPGMPPFESTSTYQYTDANCSFKEFTDGVLSSTVTNDDKYSPFTTPESHAMGVVPHNPLRTEDSEGAIRTSTYTYNEQNYPTKAVHTFSGTSTEPNYTEEFTYY